VRGVPTPQAAAESVCIAPWPSYSEGWVDQAIKVRIKRMQDLVGLIRETRNRYLSRDPRTPLDIAVRTSESNAQDLWSLSSFISLLGSTGKMDFGPIVSKPPQSATQVHPDFELYVSLAGLIDVPSEVARLKKQLMEKEKAILSAKSKLANTSFVERAKPDVVQGVKDQIGDLEKQIQIIHQTLHDLDGK
ncbi:MAG: valine--tRNA ligase, partial [Gemmataceae bacterium]